MDDLVAFLRARLAEDEQAAHAAVMNDAEWTADPDGYVIFNDEPEPFMYSVEWSQRAEHIARHDPARVLREVEAKRHIVDWAERAVNVVNEDNYNMDPDMPMLLLALPYADHPDYREEWRP